MTATNATDSIFDRYALQTDSSGSKSVNEMNQEDFLELMTAQMQNQDPFNPSDNGEFMTQMAQFSQVNALDQLNDSFSDFAANMLSSQTLQATGLLGRSIMVDGSQVQLEEGASVNASLDLTSRTRDVVVSIKDGSGALVDQISLGTVNPGLRDFTWDGTDLDGNEMPEGNYYISAEGLSEDGVGTTLDTLVPNTVSSVSIADSKVILNTNNGNELSLSDVRHIM